MSTLSLKTAVSKVIISSREMNLTIKVTLVAIVIVQRGNMIREHGLKKRLWRPTRGPSTKSEMRPHS